MIRSTLVAAALLLAATSTCAHDTDPRVRDAGIAPGIYPTGTYNAITDVDGVLVGQISIIEDNFVRTGVTAILPHGGNLFQDKVPAGFSQGNGFGKIVGTTQIIELGEVETPILLTNTLSVPEVASGTIEWTLAQPGNEDVRSVNAVVGETNDGRINNIRQRAVQPTHAVDAIESARSGPVAEGSVGAGVGTVMFGWKGGIGTSSRKLPEELGGYTVGVLVQTNYGGTLAIMGVPMVAGELLAMPDKVSQATSPDGSIMIIIATDAPLSDRSLQRLATRSFMSLARTGSYMSNGSGDYAGVFNDRQREAHPSAPQRTTRDSCAA